MGTMGADPPRPPVPGPPGGAKRSAAACHGGALHDPAATLGRATLGS